MKSWAVWAAITLGTAWISGSSMMFRVSVWVFGVIGVLAVLFWLTPLGRAAFAQFEREELVKRRDQLDARLGELDGRNRGASSKGS